MMRSRRENLAGNNTFSSLFKLKQVDLLDN